MLGNDYLGNDYYYRSRLLGGALAEASYARAQPCFTTFRPATAASPFWGETQTQAALAQCRRKLAPNQVLHIAMQTLHHLNILVHIVFGTLALLVGLVPLLMRKGGAAHRRFGRWFLALATAVLFTAVLGLAVFNFRPFLTVIVLLSVYQAFSGYRVLRTRATGPTLRDGVFSVVFLLGGLAFLALLPRIELVWSPVVMYSTLGVLLAMTVYDLSRFGWLAQWQRGAWLYEHIWKMTSTYAALLSAFTGTVLEAYKPYSQYVPSLLGSVVAVSFMLYAYRQRRRTAGMVAA